MYSKRAKIFIVVCAVLLLGCVLRLAQMQLLTASSVQEQIERLKLQRNQSEQLKTIRGTIYDRKGRILADDEPQFHLHMSYALSKYLDLHVTEAMRLQAAADDATGKRLFDVQTELADRLDDLQLIIDQCSKLGAERTEIEQRLRRINDKMWNLRAFIAWVRMDPDPNILADYNDNVNSVPLSVALADLERRIPDRAERLMRILDVDDLPDMDATHPFLELTDEDDLFAAQVEFTDINDIAILPQGHRHYPYTSVAAQTIGWVGPATQERDRQLFADDRLASYLDDDICGREDGVEHVCEPILRGRRGELVYDIDRRLYRTETEFGDDVTLTLDIELQRRIEEHLADAGLNPYADAGMSAVVIDVASGDILALVSLPTFDLNTARYDYATLTDPNRKEPLRNRALNQHYAPGSVVKPFVLTAALQTNAITPDQTISCPAGPAPATWPSCWIYRQHRSGHDLLWSNNARNAIRGSCNIYFSHLADRLDALSLQHWLFKFGFGRHVSLALPRPEDGSQQRHLRQVPGRISTGAPRTNDRISSFEQIPRVADSEKRLFGIGHGNLRATPLQVANAFAAIARDGIYKQPRLFLSATGTDSGPAIETALPDPGVNLNISPEAMSTVLDGMSAVVAERDGNAYQAFLHSGLAEQDVKVYGKTGSTEAPVNAWFAGFAVDSLGRKLALALVIEGGQHGSSDAAPLGRDIIQFCVDAGYIGARPQPRLDTP